MFGRSYDDVIFVPISTARMRVSGRSSRGVPDQVGNIYLTVDPGFDIGMAEDDIKEVMREQRRIAPGADDDFSVANFSEFIRARNETSATLGLLLAATAAIALIVGGIGIMNIMLVSVTERTREIGILKALGATRQDILLQFLIEAVMLCLVGGLIGIALGYGVGAFASAMLPGFPPAFVPTWAIFLSFGFSVAVGVIFGIIPAAKAAKLDPIDALRYE